jgi:hypothetical protein
MTTAIRRSFDASEIHPILNYESRVFEAIKLPGMKPGDIDVTPVIANPLNVLLMVEGGGIIFAQQEPGILRGSYFISKAREKKRRHGSSRPQRLLERL